MNEPVSDEFLADCDKTGMFGAIVAEVIARRKAEREAKPVAVVHWPLWGEPMLVWNGLVQPRPSNVDLYAKARPK